jgi:hypothetical protein
MNNKKTDAMIDGHQYKSPESVQMMQTADGKKIAYYELFVFRSILEKLMSVDQEDYTWTWDHETDTFLIQAQNNIIQQYIDILTRELGEALCLHLERASIIVDLRPWKTDSDKTSLRIGIEGNHIPPELRGHTGLEDLIKLHFISLPDDSPVVQKSLENFKRMCYRVDSILDRKFEWMWEKHWRKEGLAFAVVRTYAWLNKYVLVEKEVELLNNAPANGQAGVKVELSTYNRGTLFNVRIAVDGLTKALKKNAHILDVFDTHFAGSIK